MQRIAQSSGWLRDGSLEQRWPLHHQAQKSTAASTALPVNASNRPASPEGAEVQEGPDTSRKLIQVCLPFFPTGYQRYFENLYSEEWCVQWHGPGFLHPLNLLSLSADEMGIRQELSPS